MRVRRDLLGPLAAFAAATATAFACALIAGYDPLEAATWARWDSIHYVSIALDGYTDTLVNCPGSEIACAHAGWFPGYSAVLAGPIALGLPSLTTAIVVSWAFCLAALMLLWRCFPLPETTEARAGVLVFAAFVPGWFYGHAIFPLSMLAFLCLVTLVLLERGRWLAAGVAGAAAAATYPLGVLLAPVAALWLAFGERDRPFVRRLPRAALTAALVVAGFAAALVASALWTGDLLGYFHAQDHPLRDPVSGIVNEIRDSFRADRVRLERARAAQAILTTLLAGAVVFLLVARRSRLTRLDVLAAMFTLAVWVVPLTQEGLSIYRSNAALLPAAPLLRHLPPPARWALAGGAFVVGIPMAVLFFQARLV
jgi:hypothetical protein